jgi:hypothetical protein
LNLTISQRKYIKESLSFKINHIFKFSILAFFLLTLSTFAQSIFPMDTLEGIRFAKICQAVNAEGYSNSAVVGHGDSSANNYFVLLATKKNKGELIIIKELKGKIEVHPILLEQDKNPAAIGVRSISISKFLDLPDVYDIVVNHHPFRLEMTSIFETHHLVRFNGSKSEKICEFSGNSGSSSSKGMRSLSYLRTISIEKVSDSKTFRFYLKAVEKNIEQNMKEEPKITYQNEVVTEYEIPPSGYCKIIK